MDKINYKALTSKARLEELKAKLNSRSHSNLRSHLDDFKKSLYSSFRNSSPKELISQKTADPFRLSKYKLSNETTHTSPKLSESDKKCKPSNLSFENSVFVKNGKREKGKPIIIEYIAQDLKDREKSELESKKLHELIPISILSKATSIISDPFPEPLQRAYIRQLKQFCGDVLFYLNK